MQHKKLFDKAEVEYITPFLKLWMAFNNWYKQDLPNIKKDRFAIDYYKKSGGKIGKEFIYLFSARADIGINFRIALDDLVEHYVKHPLQNDNDEEINYSPGLLTQNEKGLSYLSTDKRNYQISEGDTDLFFRETLEIIYQIRCTLFHGNFDIENQDFIKIVESAYKIMYPIMDRIFEKENNQNAPN